MKIVILSASTGGGHMSAANALKDYINSNNETAVVIDAIEYISPFLNKTVTEIYEYVATKNPLLWKVMYKSSNKKTINNIIGKTNSLISNKLIPLLESHSPDVIVTTHPFTTEMISKLKKHKKINTPLVCIMTDYAPHRTWINPYVDDYVVANEEMISPMIDMDVQANKIHPFGIPVDDAFFNHQNKKDLLNELNLKDGIPTILIMAGSCGLANIEKIYSDLQSIKTEFQIIIITGKNKKLYENMQNLISGKKSKIKNKILAKISEKAPELKHMKFIKRYQNKISSNQSFKNTRLIYFTDEVEKYMNVSDLILTKPGGLTVSEALACNLPMALYDAIPGQEEENADFLVSKNMAIKLNSSENVAQTIGELLSNPEKLNSMKYNCTNFDKSDSLKNIFSLIKNLAKQ